MPEGKLPGSNSPAVPFSYLTENPLAGISPTTADTNYGRATETKDRKIPFIEIPKAPQSGTFGSGTWLGGWGKK